MAQLVRTPAETSARQHRSPRSRDPRRPTALTSICPYSEPAVAPKSLLPLLFAFHSAFIIHHSAFAFISSPPATPQNSPAPERDRSFASPSCSRPALH